MENTIHRNPPGLKILIVLFSFFVTHHAIAQEKYPEAEIKNEHLRVKVYLPDAKKGYYRATRFDWSGVIGSLEYKGHQYFAPWVQKHDPTLHEAITGPVEAFAPIGFASSKQGETFLTIGVGMLGKPDEGPYHYSTTYPIKNPGQWKVRKKYDRVEFTHILTDESGYAYEYTKTVRLIKGKPEMVLENSLKNTGTKPIETTVYNHNFFVIDQEPTGPNIVTKFPYPVQAEGRGFGEIILTREDALVFTRGLEKGESVFTSDLKRSGPEDPDYNIRVENIKSGAGVQITSDKPLLRLAYWACHTTACPEPFIRLRAEPGQVFSWKTVYTFYTFPIAGREK